MITGEGRVFRSILASEVAEGINRIIIFMNPALAGFFVLSFTQRRNGAKGRMRRCVKILAALAGFFVSGGDFTQRR
jgi:hypothetical protein